MARVNQVIDDLDGTISDDVDTRYFGLDGKYYEIDLSKENYDALVGELEPFVAVARPWNPKKHKPKRGKSQGKGNSRRPAGESQDIREWARANGWPNISDYGRIPRDVVQAYTEHKKAQDEREDDAPVDVPA